MYLSFLNPKYLYLLFLIPFAIFFYFYSLKNTGGKTIKFANFDEIARIKGIDIYSRNIIILLLDILLIVVLSVSLSGPIMHRQVEASAFSFVIAVDSSESMGASDISPSRMAVAKETADNFVDSLPDGSRIGVISFSMNSKVEMDVSDNREEVKKSIDKIQLSEFGGTDLYEAVSISSFLLKNEKEKAIMLLSDGQIINMNPDEIIKNALNNNIIIHTFGIGSVSGGEFSYGISKIDEDTLKNIANQTNGFYFNVENKEQLQDSFSQILTLAEMESSYNVSFYLMILFVVLIIVRYALYIRNSVSI